MRPGRPRYRPRPQPAPPAGRDQVPDHVGAHLLGPRGTRVALPSAASTTASLFVGADPGRPDPVDHRQVASLGGELRPPVREDVVGWRRTRDDLPAAALAASSRRICGSRPAAAARAAPVFLIFSWLLASGRSSTTATAVTTASAPPRRPAWPLPPGRPIRPLHLGAYRVVEVHVRRARVTSRPRRPQSGRARRPASRTTSPEEAVTVKILPWSATLTTTQQPARSAPARQCPGRHRTSTR